MAHVYPSDSFTCINDVDNTLHDTLSEVGPAKPKVSSGSTSRGKLSPPIISGSLLDCTKRGYRLGLVEPETQCARLRLGLAEG